LSDYQRNKYYIKHYGISLETYNKIFETQSGSCAICGKPQNHFRRRLAVDHDHKTKQVRGLLCSYCNRAIGGFDDNISLLEKATEYLKKYRD
jgi:hypothetical protein